MSENQDNKEPPSDSQETFYDKSQIVNINESQMLDESQDFALVVGEDSDESVKNQSQAVKGTGDSKNDDNPMEKIIIQPETQLLDDSPPISDIAEETKNVPSRDDELVEAKSNENLETEDDIDRSKSNGSDEEDMIHGTPPEIHSPSRKLLSGTIAVKRKAESLDEPAAKIQKIASDSKALELDGEKLEALNEREVKGSKLFARNISIQEKESQLDIFCGASETWESNQTSETDDTQRIAKNIIIAETQDTEEFEPTHSISSSKYDDKCSNDELTESDRNEKISEDKRDTEIDEKKSNDGGSLDTEQEIERSDEKVSSETADQAVKTTTHEKVLEKTVRNSKDHSESTDITAEVDLGETEIIEQKKTAEKKDDKVDKEYLNVPLPSSDSASDSNCESGSMNSNRSRKSIECIYDKKSAIQERKKMVPLVEIDEEGDKIILDSSTEDYHLHMSTDSLNSSPKNTTVYKSCIDSKTNSESSYKSTGWNEVHGRNETVEPPDSRVINGDEDGASSTAKTVSIEYVSSVSDIMSDPITPVDRKSTMNVAEAEQRFPDLSPKLNDSTGLINSISDVEQDNRLVDENLQDKSRGNGVEPSNRSANTKTTVIEKEIQIYVKMKYLSHVDDATKEIVSNEVTNVFCEPIVEPGSPKENNDTSGCLADISGNGNKDTSPGSVNSNPQHYQLPLSRLSMASTLSSSSSISSAASLAMKFCNKVHFSMPKGRAKHTRRSAIGSIMEEKLHVRETFDRGSCRWENTQLITEAVVQAATLNNTSPDLFHAENEPGKTEDQILSSTPEPPKDEEEPSHVVTPKSTKAKKALKRMRTKSIDTPKKNGMRSGRKVSPEVITTSQEDRPPVTKKKRESNDSVEPDIPAKETTNVSTPSRLRVKSDSLRSLTPQNLPNDELMGKVVFAKWSDNNYYPGEVTAKSKNKFSVKFYDGKSKSLIEEFVIPIPDVLRDGLSVYATTKDDDYGSMGIIVKSEKVKNVTHYTVEMDNGKRVQVETKDIFLKPDQAQILKEEISMESKNIPKTPQHLGQVSLDNLVDGKRRSKRAATPTISTPKSRKGVSPKASRITDSISPSGSGVVAKGKGKEKEISSSESETKANDSNASTIEDVDGVQPELVTMQAAQVSKGPSTRMKGKGRGKSKQTYDDLELGPIPPPNSSIFKNMSFILTSTSSDIISRHHTDDSCSEAGTENEEEWLNIPFCKDRVEKQLINGGGTVYHSFKLIPPAEYKNTKLITNVPNLTAKSIQCLSVRIPAYSHKWVIQCCRENKTIKPTQYELPVGWSLEKKKYVEADDRINKQPFTNIMIGLPVLEDRSSATRSTQFWRRICENAGAGVQIINDQATNFCHVTVIMTDNRCPSWLVEKAENWDIPLVSTVWVIQSIIEGQVLELDSHPQYKHTFIQS